MISTNVHAGLQYHFESDLVGLWFSIFIPFSNKTNKQKKNNLIERNYFRPTKKWRTLIFFKLPYLIKYIKILQRYKLLI